MQKDKKVKKTARWMICEAFALRGDVRSLSVLDAWCVSCETLDVAMRSLRKSVKERVEEYWEGAFDEEAVESDIEEVIAGGEEVAPNIYAYRFFKDDREIVWKIFREKKVNAGKQRKRRDA